MFDLILDAAAAAAQRQRAAPWPDWTGQPVIVVASGPSAAACDLERIRGRARVIAVNGSVRRAPEADALFAADGRWWQTYRSFVTGFRGLRASSDTTFAARTPDLLIRPVDAIWPPVLLPNREHIEAALLQDARFELGKPGRVWCFMGHSGPLAVNLALSLGSRRIALVGFDMHVNAGPHWFGSNPSPCSDPTPQTLNVARILMDAAAPSAAPGGAEIVVAGSPGSALENYPKMGWGDAVDWLLR